MDADGGGHYSGTGNHEAADSTPILVLRLPLGGVGESESDDEEYVVEQILKKRKKLDGTFEYYIKWKGYEDWENTWEPSKHLNCPHMLEEFEKSWAARQRSIQLARITATAGPSASAESSHQEPSTSRTIEQTLQKKEPQNPELYSSLSNEIKEGAANLANGQEKEKAAPKQNLAKSEPATEKISPVRKQPVRQQPIRQQTVKNEPAKNQPAKKQPPKNQKKAQPKRFAYTNGEHSDEEIDFTPKQPRTEADELVIQERRNAMLAAAERRREQAEQRGVQGKGSAEMEHYKNRKEQIDKAEEKARMSGESNTSAPLTWQMS